jgi:hypothetical protein
MKFLAAAVLKFILCVVSSFLFVRSLEKKEYLITFLSGVSLITACCLDPKRWK